MHDYRETSLLTHHCETFSLLPHCRKLTFAGGRGGGFSNAGIKRLEYLAMLEKTFFYVKHVPSPFGGGRFLGKEGTCLT